MYLLQSQSKNPWKIPSLRGGNEIVFKETVIYYALPGYDGN